MATDDTVRKQIDAEANESVGSTSSNASDNGNSTADTTNTNDSNDNVSEASNQLTKESIDDDDCVSSDSDKKPSNDTILSIPTPMIGGFPLPSPSLDTSTMIKRMQARMPDEPTPYDAIAESTDEERIAMGYTGEIMRECGAMRVRGEYPTRKRHDELLAEALPPLLAKFSRKMLLWMIGMLALGIVWACVNGISWIIGVLIGIGLFILAAIGEMLGLMRDVRTTDGLDYCAAYESNVKSFDWEKAAKLAASKKDTAEDYKLE